jgi:hypothetical protein
MKGTNWSSLRSRKWREHFDHPLGSGATRREASKESRRALGGADPRGLELKLELKLELQLKLKLKLKLNLHFGFDQRIFHPFEHLFCPLPFAELSVALLGFA